MALSLLIGQCPWNEHDQVSASLETEDSSSSIWYLCAKVSKDFHRTLHGGDDEDDLTVMLCSSFCSARKSVDAPQQELPTVLEYSAKYQTLKVRSMGTERSNTSRRSKGTSKHSVARIQTSASTATEATAPVTKTSRRRRSAMKGAETGAYKKHSAVCPAVQTVPPAKRQKQTPSAFTKESDFAAKTTAPATPTSDAAVATSLCSYILTGDANSNRNTTTNTSGKSNNRAKPTATHQMSSQMFQKEDGTSSYASVGTHSIQKFFNHNKQCGVCVSPSTIVETLYASPITLSKNTNASFGTEKTVSLTSTSSSDTSDHSSDHQQKHHVKQTQKPKPTPESVHYSKFNKGLHNLDEEANCHSTIKGAEANATENTLDAAAAAATTSTNITSSRSATDEATIIRLYDDDDEDDGQFPLSNDEVSYSSASTTLISHIRPGAKNKHIKRGPNLLPFERNAIALSGDVATPIPLPKSTPRLCSLKNKDALQYRRRRIRTMMMMSTQSTKQESLKPQTIIYNSNNETFPSQNQVHCVNTEVPIATEFVGRNTLDGFFHNDIDNYDIYNQVEDSKNDLMQDCIAQGTIEIPNFETNQDCTIYIKTSKKKRVP